MDTSTGGSDGSGSGRLEEPPLEPPLGGSGSGSGSWMVPNWAVATMSAEMTEVSVSLVPPLNQPVNARPAGGVGSAGNRSAPLLP